ncbi:hypothetical protein [Arthrobacter sp. MMS18-M83]|uniref:hypothetical protein n=1 Tax=Arthrobacter sp. MMS18-M83 TaxID=2996261 RepID=UPI00227B19DD|nr:hypothetical protein [Arthrobacter sp. MMS18-M83]WAH97671.1 hypothetical protein OW521_01860 [Arthrobacter sp. MMS18-M83]
MISTPFQICSGEDAAPALPSFAPAPGLRRHRSAGTVLAVALAVVASAKVGSAITKREPGEQ